MSEKRILAILGLLLGLLAAILILLGIVGIGRNETISLAFLLDRLIDLVLGIVILVGSLMIYRRNYSSGGIVNLVIGIVVIILGPSTTAGILAILSGVLGLLANEARS